MTTKSSRWGQTGEIQVQLRISSGPSSVLFTAHEHSSSGTQEPVPLLEGRVGAGADAVAKLVDTVNCHGRWNVADLQRTVGGIVDGCWAT